MKLRKHIQHLKLQHIKKKYQYICVFHCSRGFEAPQWRRFKNSLYIDQANTIFQPNGLPTSGAATLDQNAIDGAFKRKKLAAQGKHSLLKIKSDNLRNKAVKKSTPIPTLSTISLTENLSPSHTNSMHNFFQLNTEITAIAGPFCIVYSTNKRENLCTNGERCFEQRFTVNHALPKWFQTIGSSEQNNNLLLLYAKLNCTTINHIDIKHAINLEPKFVLEQFMWSMHYLMQYFDFCLNQGANHFIQYGVQQCANQHNE